MIDIDREVAEKVMGWVEHNGYWVRSELLRGAGYPKITVHDTEHLIKRWSPSTRIDHAWEAVEKLNLWSMEWHQDCSPSGEVGYDITIWTDSENPSGGWGRTIPEAICHAALDAVESGEG